MAGLVGDQQSAQEMVFSKKNPNYGPSLPVCPVLRCNYMNKAEKGAVSAKKKL